MKVFVTGGAGFVGASVIGALLDKGHTIHALVNHKKVDRERVQSFPGGLFDNAALDAGMRGCEAVVHLVGIIKENRRAGITFNRIHYEGTQKVVDAAKRAGISRYVHMSALGASADSPANYHLTKFHAEEYVRSGGLGWTIIRPSLIHGPLGEFTEMEKGWAKGKALPFVFMPYFGSGLLGLGKKSKIQPVFVDDVASAFTNSLEDPDKIHQTFELGGSQVLTWPQMHAIAAQIFAGHNRFILPIPAWYANAITRITPSALLPFTRDQVLMSQQDNTCDLAAFVKAFGWTPRGFEESLRSYAKS